MTIEVIITQGGNNLWSIVDFKTYLHIKCGYFKKLESAINSCNYSKNKILKIIDKKGKEILCYTQKGQVTCSERLNKDFVL